MTLARSIQKLSLAALLLALLALLAAGCGDSEDSEATTTTTTEASDTETPPTSEGEATPTTEAPPLPALTDPVSEECMRDKLTVATSDPAFPPYVIDFDPTNQMGFESAVVYAVAGQLGVEPSNVTWTSAEFYEAISATPKDYDFNIQQYTITEEREEVVDFSESYYSNEQAIIGLEDSSIIGATSLSDLKSARLGAQLGSTSLTYIEDIIKPDSDARVYNDNVAAKAAFDAGQIDGLVVDLPTAYYVTAVEIEDASIIGVLPRMGGATDELGMLFEEGSELVPCVNQALRNLKATGSLDALADRWLKEASDLPVLTP